MSGVIVLAPVAGSLAGAAAMMVAAPFVIGGTVLVGAAQLGNAALNALEESNRRKLEKQRQETETLGREIARLARSAAKKAPPVLTAEFLEENRRAIGSALAQLDLEKVSLDIDAVKGPDSGSPGPEPGPECRELFAALAFVSHSSAKACEKLMVNIEAAPIVRQKAVLNNLRIEYGNAIRMQAAQLWRKRKISEASAALTGEAAAEFEKALAASGWPDADVTEGIFENLRQAYTEALEKDCRRKQNEILEKSLIRDMIRLGYSPIGNAARDAPIFFSSGERDYRIMARVNPQNGQLSLRFVRVVANEREKNSITTAQKRRDLEQEKKWCEKASRLIAALSAETGSSFTELYRKEPEENSEVLVVVDESLAQREREGRENAAN